MMPACIGFYPLVSIVLVNQTIKDTPGEETALHHSNIWFFAFNSLALLGGWWIAEDYRQENRKW
jgi:cytochrome bd-type quinol oxidase subunit 1